MIDDCAVDCFSTMPLRLYALFGTLRLLALPYPLSLRLLRLVVRSLRPAATTHLWWWVSFVLTSDFACFF